MPHLSRVFIKDKNLKKYGGFTAIPNCAINDTTLSFGARLTFLYLWQIAYKTNPTKQTELSAMLGTKERQLRSYLAELKIRKLIDYNRPAIGLPNSYEILSVIAAPVGQNIASPENPSVRQVVAHATGKNLPHISLEGNNLLKQENLPSVNSSQQPTEENAFPYLPEGSEPPPLPPAPPPPNILAWANAEWEKVHGGTLSFGRLGRATDHVRKKHGNDAFKRQWVAYLGEVDGKFASPEHFAGRFLSWGKKKQQSKAVSIDALRKARRA